MISEIVVCSIFKKINTLAAWWSYFSSKNRENEVIKYSRLGKKLKGNIHFDSMLLSNFCGFP